MAVVMATGIRTQLENDGMVGKSKHDTANLNNPTLNAWGNTSPLTLLPLAAV